LKKIYLVLCFVILLVALSYGAFIWNPYDLPERISDEIYIGNPIFSGSSGEIISYDYSDRTGVLCMTYSIGEHLYNTASSPDYLQAHCEEKNESLIDRESKINDTDLYFEFYTDCGSKTGDESIYLVKGVIKGEDVYWCKKLIWFYGKNYYSTNCTLESGRAIVNYTYDGFVGYEEGFVKIVMP